VNGAKLTKIQFLKAMNEIAPDSLAEEWDNVGMLIDCGKTEYGKILFALTLTENVAEQAEKAGADLVVTHHPVMLSGVRRLDGETDESRAIIRLIKNGISHFAAHTNLDCANIGTNAVTARLVGLIDAVPLCGNGMGRIGTLNPAVTLSELGGIVGRALSPADLRIAGDPKQIIRKLAVVTGSGMSLAKEAKAAGADAILTGDARYHNAAEAAGYGLAVIDAGHFATERPAMSHLIQGLQEHFDTLQCKLAIMTELCLAREDDAFWSARAAVE